MINIKQNVKEMLKRRSLLLRALIWTYNHISFSNIFRGLHGNVVNLCCALLRKTAIKINGQGNTITLEAGVRLTNCNIYVVGNGNKIFIGEYCDLNNVEIWIEDDNNEILIGDSSTFAGRTHIACIEGTRVDIGCDCMFSANIVVRTGDAHSILNKETQARINPSKDVLIGNHVWVGNHATILKGTAIGDNSIVATEAIVTKKFEENNIVLAGNPAKIAKRGINWDRQRI